MSRSMMDSSPPDILVRIVERRRERLGVSTTVLEPRAAATRASPVSLTDQDVPKRSAANAFVAALARRRGEAIIAEVKMGSPKLGSLAGRFDPERQASSYAANGAAALSVVVEPDFFHGSYELLERCQRASGLPAIAKDFLVSERQLEWAREAGASAVLLIASLLSPEELARYAECARALGLAPLVETHDLGDLEKLGTSQWEMVGVNNRDLRTFEVDIDHSLALVDRLPQGALRVAESGIHGRDDVVELARGGFDAFLIGETLLLADDPSETLRGLLGR